MMPWSRFLKIGLPVTTVATATAVTVSLICLYRNDDKDKKDLNNEELNDFQNNLKPFEETTISYPENPKPKGDNNPEGKEIVLEGDGAVILGTKEESEGGASGESTLDKEKEAGMGEGSIPKIEDIPNIAEGALGAKDGSEPTNATQEDSESGSPDSRSEVLGQEEGQTEVGEKVLGEGLDNNDGSQGQASKGTEDDAKGLAQNSEDHLVAQAGQEMESEGVASEVNNNGQSHPGVSVIESENVGDSNLGGVDTGGVGAPEKGLDPYSDHKEETKDLEKELEVLNELDVALKLNGVQLSQVLI